jgi:RNA polymerase sigma-B factor
MPALRAGRTTAATTAATAQATAAGHRWRNRDQLHALQAAVDPNRRLELRNTLVAANLGLVFGLARSLGHSHRLDHEDLAQVASIGLIRAVEAYDPGRGTALSTFALPYIRGAILHELRDRRHLVRVPRDLWELRQQVNRLQEQRRRSGAPPLAPAELTERLGCGSAQLRDLEELALREAPCCLDAPAAGGVVSIRKIWTSNFYIVRLGI